MNPFSNAAASAVSDPFSQMINQKIKESLTLSKEQIEALKVEIKKEEQEENELVEISLHTAFFVPKHLSALGKRGNC